MNLGHAHKPRFWYLLGVLSKFSNEHPRPFYRRVPLPPPRGVDVYVPSYYNSGRSRTDFKISLQYSSRFHIISKESIWCKRMRVLNYSLQGTLGCSNWFRTDRRGRGFTESSLAWLVLMRKKVITRLCHVSVKPGPGEEHVHVLDLGIKKLSIKILGCLPSPHSTW